jgi:hypothetical protein
MERFIADLHIHSRFSRATSKALTPRLLAAWARIKGIDVIGTGDFTHPEWLSELEEQLVDDGSGLFVLKESEKLHEEIDWLQEPVSGQTRFMIQGEISSIYKKWVKSGRFTTLFICLTLKLPENLMKSSELSAILNQTAALYWDLIAMIFLKWSLKQMNGLFLSQLISGLRGFHFSVPNQDLILSKSALGIYRPKFLRWKQGFLQIRR